MKIKYNAPTVLSYALLCALVMAVTLYLLPGLRDWFMVPGRGNFSPGSLRCWITLLSHVIGHSGWAHLVSNFSIILLVGPMLEESYGSLALLVMIAITALVTGILNVFFFPSALMGASGVVFMMILLASFTNFTHGEIPLTFILILTLYIGDQLFKSFGGTGNISHFAHIAGGFCGSLFGFFISPKQQH
jgi:membrane associated rhomboid family serine protease